MIKIQMQFPNGMVGKPYDHTLGTLRAGERELTVKEVFGLEHCGLQFDSQDGGRIFGTPSTAGDFQVRVHYLYTTDDPSSPPWEAETLLIINPDPRSLWKTLDTPDDAPFQKENGAHLQLEWADRTIVVASQRGRSHAQDGKFREDDGNAYIDPATGWAVVVVADGAGSAGFSREGSRQAVDAVCDYFREIGEEALNGLSETVGAWQAKEENAESKLRSLLYTHLAKAAWDASKRIQTLAAAEGRVTKEFATTLVFGLFRKFDFGWFAAGFGVGDSPMGVLLAEGEPEVFHSPEEGEFASQTWFLTMPEVFQDSAKIMDRIHFNAFPDFKAIMLMTDGVYDPKFQTRANFARRDLWDNLWSELSQSMELKSDNQNLGESLLGWMNFWSPGNHDDRTLAIIF